MAVGINTNKIHSLQLNLLDSIEALKALKDRFENCSIAISNDIEGSGKTNITNDLNIMKSQFTTVISNIDSYITDLNKIVSSYINQDDEIKQQIIKDVEKIEVMEGE